MKKILTVLVLSLILTGCKNQLKCTKTTEEEHYKTEQSIIFNLDKNNKVKSSENSYTMIFENEVEAQNYFNVFNSLSEDYDLTKNKNKLILKYSVDDLDNQTKSDLKDQYEKSGYTCK